MITNINILQNINQANFKGRQEAKIYVPLRMTPPLKADTFEKHPASAEQSRVQTNPALANKQTENIQHPFKKISYNKAKNMLTVKSIKAVQEFMRSNKTKMDALSPADKNPVIEDMFEIDGEKYNASFSGSGGTKNVFQIEKDGKKYALALPSYTDGPNAAGNKWLNVLEFEPENTAFLRRHGFKTNDIFDIVPVKVAGVEFPAVLMKPYSEHSFEIADTKNYSFVNLYDAENMNSEKVIAMLQPAIKEIGRLLNFGIPPRVDCVSICKDKDMEEFHLYLNDLDIELMEDFPETFIPSYITGYIYSAVSAFCNAVPADERHQSDYLCNRIHSDEKLINTLKKQIWDEYKKAKSAEPAV